MNLPENKKKGNKFNAKKTEYNGRVFDSKAEAHRAYELDMLQLSGDVTKIEYQPVFDVIVEGQKICKYKADFRVTYHDGHVEVEDVKGLKKGAAYSYFLLKKKLVEAIYKIKVIEI